MPATRTPTRPSRRARRCSTPPSAASAVAPSLPARPATSAQRTSSTCSTVRASRRASTSTRSSPSPSGSRASSGGSYPDRSIAPAHSSRWRAEGKEGTRMAYRLGVDVGGTFTDLFLVGDGDGNGGGRYRVKTPSTLADPSEGVLNGVKRICEEAGIGVGDLRNILH